MTTDAPPAAEPRPAADDLQARVDRLAGEVGERVGALRAAARDVADRLRALAAEAAEAHRRAREAHGLDAEPGSAEALWAALTGYRRDAADAHANLRAGLRRLDVGAALAAPFTGGVAALPALAEATPLSVTRAEPPGLLDPEPGDSVRLRARKAAERARRRLRAAGRSVRNAPRRLVRKPPVGAEAALQTVPLRDLFEEHLRLRVPRLLLAEHERVQEAAARAVARVEAAAAAWADDLLRLEAAFDRPAFHRPPEPAAPSGPSLPDEAARASTLDALRALADAFDAALRDGAAFALPAPEAEALTEAHAALAERVRRSGFDEAPARPVPPPAERLATRAEHWAAWQRHTLGRLDVDGVLLDFRERLSAEVGAFVADVASGTVVPLDRAAGAAADLLGQLRAETAAAFERSEAADPSALAPEVRRVLDAALAHLDRVLLPALQPLSLDGAATEAADGVRARLGPAVAALPERLGVHVSPDPERVGGGATVTHVELRRIAGELVTDPFARRLRQSADPLRQPLFRVLNGVEGVRDVVRFNLETALDALEAGPDGAEDGRAEARELILSGLARSEERLRALAAPLAEPWEAVVAAAVDAFERAWAGLHARLGAEGLVESQLLDLRARFARLGGRFRSEGGRVAERSRRLSGRLFRRGTREAAKLVRLGQAAAGLAEADEAERQRTLDALTGADALRAPLPLVYRRLFSFEPVTDPLLLVGRDRQVERVRARYERWRAGTHASALVIAAEPGGGRTSFVNGLRAAVFPEAEAAVLALNERLESADDFARRLAGALGLPEDAAEDLDALERTLSHPDAPRRVCVVENLEHLLLRAPQGLDLIERVLVFFSRTDHGVFWVGTMGLPGWRFVERTAPEVSGLVDVVELPALTRAEVETALMRRHTRSGLPLTFAPPEPVPPLLARRLARAKSEADRQDLLRQEYFDGLFRSSGGQVGLALLHWLRGATFTAAEGAAEALTLAPARPLDFSFLARFDLPRAFALKAFLQHGTLTLAEHDRIFRTARAESFLLFESLHNLRLIQRADGDAARGAVDEAGRYRLHPLAIGPVTEALRGKNLL